MRFLRLLGEHMRQVLSWRLLVCGVGVTLVLAGAISGLLANREPSYSVWYLLDRSISGSGAMTVAVCILPALSHSVTLPLEWESRATP